MNVPHPFMAAWPRRISIILACILILPAAEDVFAARPIGIDVSDYQSAGINWNTLKNTYGISFGWAKASEGGSSTGGSHWPAYVANAKAAGVYIGPYHYARYDLNAGTSGAISEANYFWNRVKSDIKADGKTLMPMLDVEADFSGQTKASLSLWVNTWCTTLSNNAAAAGLRLKPCVYTSSSKAAAYFDSTVTKWNTDIANWPYAHASAATSAQTAGSPPAGITPWTSWQFWQYDDQNVAQAITTGDGDIFNGTLAQMTNTMLVTPLGPTITSQPADITMLPGGTQRFSVSAAGLGTLHYQWRFNGVNINGATASQLIIGNVQLANAGGYSVLVTDNSGGNLSDIAFLSVQAPLMNSPGSVVIPSGLVNWWTADGNFIDILGGANGTAQGGVSFAAGRSGLAFHGDGSTSLITTSAGNLAVPWTASMWVYRQDSPQSSAGLLEDGTYALKLEQYNGTRQVGLTVLGVGDYIFSPAYTVPQNTWTHLVFVGTSSGTTLYANGVAKGTVPTSIPLPRKYIAATYITSSAKYVDFMMGSIDDIMTFNRALTAPEIGALYSAGAAGYVRAPQITSASVPAPGKYRVNLKGLTGRNYTIYSSTNMEDWVQAGVASNSAGTNFFIYNWATNDMEFFRASQP